MPFSKQHYQSFIITIVLSAFWLIFSYKINYRAIFKSKVMVVAMAYATLFLISITWSNDPTWNDKFKDVKTFLYLLFFAIVFLYSLDGKSSRLISLINYFIVAAVVSLFINLYVFYGLNHEPLSARFAGLGRLWNPLWAAAMYGAAALIVISMLFNKFTALKPTVKYALILSYILLFIAIVLTQSRTPIAAVILMSFIALMFSNQSIKTKLMLTLIGGIIAFSVLIYFLPVLYEYTVVRGQSYRLDLWLGFFERAREHLILGHGGGSTVAIQAPGEFVDGWYHYHSTYLASLVEMGIVGLILHLVVILTTLKIAWKLRDNFYVKTAAFVFIYACILGLTFGHGILTRMNTQWLIFWMPVLIIAMYEIRYHERSVRRHSSALLAKDDARAFN